MGRRGGWWGRVGWGLVVVVVLSVVLPVVEQLPGPVGGGGLIGRARWSR